MDWINIALFLIPAYIANASAMVVGMLLKSKTSLDFGIMLPDGQPLLGKGKTWKGTVSGIVFGTLAAAVVFFLFPKEASSIANNYVIAGFLISLGAILGDLAGSFIKRRLMIKSGSPTPILDQLDFIVGGYLLLSLIYLPSAEEFLFVCVFTVITHIATNYIAFRLKLKKVPW
jgi:CDP-2,3-bis-(O-geranylgeranyl)-sn-glycerol synthase